MRLCLTASGLGPTRHEPAPFGHAYVPLVGQQAEKLSLRVLALCQDPAVVLYLSLVSLWEIQIKSGLGKLPLALPLQEILRDQQAQGGLQLLPITPAHIFALGMLPHYHNDPFDRLLIAQSISEGLPLASVDDQFSSYAASVIW